MTYAQALEYLYAQLPMYHRVGPAAYKPDLTNTLKIAEMLGKPQTRLKAIHVAGTNGKGSSSHMLAAILQQSRYRTGLYTSPHLVDFRERIRVNGKMIPKQYVVDFITKYQEQFAEIKPSFFEWTFGLALDYFAHEEVDVAVIEVGLGGRLDSTNIITPKVCLITNVSMDHMDLLGDSIEKIGREKAGIIKPRVPVVVSQYQSETAPIFSTLARELKCPIEYADKNFRVTGSRMLKDILEVSVLDRDTEQVTDYELDLTGSYQVKNLLGVLNVIRFVEKAGYIIEPDNIRKGLRNVCKLTGFAGRWEKLSEKPLVIADTGHNEDGIRHVVDNFKHISYANLHIVLGTVNDKKIDRILPLLPKKAHYYFVKANIPRALDENELARHAQKLKLNGKPYPTVAEGLKAAKKAAGKNDLVFIGGSTFVVGDAMAEMKK